MQTKDRFIFNNNVYMVVLPIKYNNEVFYFVINEKNENDYFFCQKKEQDIIPLKDKTTIESLLTYIDDNMNK